MNFINGEVPLALQVAWVSSAVNGSESLIAGGVGGETSDNIVSTSILKNLLKDVCNLLEVVVPSEPSTVSGINI